MQATMLDNLLEHGWSQHHLFFPTELVIALAAECLTLRSINALTLARVGRGTQQAVQPDIRGDQILWLNTGQSIACDQYLQIMESVRLVLNRHLYLGLEEYESHFAFYSAGASYAKHVDRFRDDDHRTISAVIYLNDHWLPEQGGALRLYPEGKCMEDIYPLASRLVLFLSADIPHEVLPATRDRMSIAGWFRRRS